MAKLMKNKPPRIYTLKGRSKYLVRFFLEDGSHIDRVAKDINGIIRPTATVFENENPEIAARVWTFIAYKSNELSDEGALSARGRYIFSTVMAEYVEWHIKHRRNKRIQAHAKRCNRYFGDMRLSQITRKKIRAAIAKMETEYADKTISHTIGTARAMFEWLTLEGKWTGANPFTKHEWNSKVAGRSIKPTITIDELQDALTLTSSRQTQQAMMIAYYTGIRPEEVCGIQESDFTHGKGLLKVRVTKTRKKPYTRLIAIPPALSVWIANNGFVSMVHGSVCRALWDIARRNPEYTGLCMETFRHNFSNMMRLAGVPKADIDIHQGRVTSIQDSAYNLDDAMFAANLMRPYIERIFATEIRRVK